MKFIDLTGLKFSRLHVVSRAPNRIEPSGKVKTQWNCVCECEGNCICESSNLKGGNSNSCGCYKRERIREDNVIHGMSNTREHEAWMRMKQRILNPNDKRFMDYGGRGITICQRWLDSFQNFFSDMGVRPSGYTLERIDVNGNYEPLNCKWATWTEQQRNRRNNHRITIGGHTATVAEWSETTDVNDSTIYRRLYSGWTPERAVFQPV